MHIIQSPLFDFEEFIKIKKNDRLAMVLEKLPSDKLMVVLEREHWANVGPRELGSKGTGHEAGQRPTAAAGLCEGAPTARTRPPQRSSTRNPCRA